MLGKCTQQLVDAPVDIATRTPACLPLGGCFLRAIKNSHMSKANTHKHIESETMALAKGKKKRRGGAENSGVGMGMGREPGSQWLLATLLQFSNGPNARGATTATTCPCPGRLCYSSCSSISRFRRTPFCSHVHASPHLVQSQTCYKSQKQAQVNDLATC